MANIDAKQCSTAIEDVVLIPKKEKEECQEQT